MESLKQRAITAFAWEYSGNLARQAASFAIGLILARLLTPREFGLVGMVVVFIELSQGVLDIGLGAALIQRKSPAPLHYSSTFVLNLALGLALTLMTFLAAPWIASFYGIPRLVQITHALAPFFLLRSMTLVHETWLRKHLRFDRLAQVHLVSVVVGGGTGIALAWTGFGVWSLVAQTLLTAVVSVAGFWLVGGWVPSVKVSLKALGELWAFGIHLFAAGMLDQIFVRVDVLIVGKLFDATTLGLFSRAKSMARFVIRFSSESIAQVMFPVLAEVQDEDERFRRVTQQTLDVVSFASFALSAWLYVVAAPLISVLLTDKWLPAAPMLKLFCLSAYVYPVNSVLLSVLKSRGHSKTFLRLEIIKKFLYSLALFVGFRFGVHGFLVALAITGFVNTTINMVVTGRSVDLPLMFFAKVVVPYGAMAGVAALTTSLLPTVYPGSVAQLATLTAGFTVLYVAFNAICRTGGLRMTLEMSRSVFGGRNLLQ